MSPNSQHGNIINTPIYNGSGITTNLVIRGEDGIGVCCLFVEVMGGEL